MNWSQIRLIRIVYFDDDENGHGKPGRYSHPRPDSDPALSDGRLCAAPKWGPFGQAVAERAPAAATTRLLLAAANRK
jgi:hypothetical protein